MIVPPRRRENFRGLYNILPRTTEKKLAKKEEEKNGGDERGIFNWFYLPLKVPETANKDSFYP